MPETETAAFRAGEPRRIPDKSGRGYVRAIDCPAVIFDDGFVGLRVDVADPHMATCLTPDAADALAAQLTRAAFRARIELSAAEAATDDAAVAVDDTPRPMLTSDQRTALADELRGWTAGDLEAALDLPMRSPAAFTTALLCEAELDRRRPMEGTRMTGHDE